MGIKRKSGFEAHVRLRLEPDDAQRRALETLFDTYNGLQNWLATTIPAGHSHDLVSLHRGFYEAARQHSGLPAQMVTLALRDWALRSQGEIPIGVPLDEKLYSVRGIAAVSLATLDGRVNVPFAVGGYNTGWHGSAPARLLQIGNDWELRIATDQQLASTGRKTIMATENVLAQIGRVIAGMTRAAIDAAENANPEAILTQSIREIDAAADEVRGELGKALAEKQRLEMRRKELERERLDLDEKIRLAVAQNRDELAEAGISRQIDIEAQTGVLARLLDDCNDRVSQLNATLDAVNASRREGEARLAEFRASRRSAAVDGAGKPVVGGEAVAGATRKVERAQAAAERVTGVPAGQSNTDQKAIDELNEMVRRHAVQERLARLKAQRS
jgi:phage shock protein A